MNLADAAQILGSDGTIMDSYWKFQKKRQGWFFSPNPKLDSFTSKPKKFSTWADWDSASINQQRTLSTLAGFNNDATNIIRNKTDLLKLTSAYSKWRYNL